MREFFSIFKKVNGVQQLKNYAKAHVLLFALVETLLLGKSRKSLELVRLSVQNRIYSRLKKQNAKLIEDFVENHPNQIKQNHKHIIWTIWLQGMSEAPYIVRKCYESMKRCYSDYEIIVITEDNYNSYVSFPEYIIEKYERGIISKVHFSDLIRVELLAKYGGTWLDGTVYCTEPIKGFHDFYLESDLFLFQNLKPGLDGHCTSISSWMITSCANHNIILLTRKLLFNYWKKYNYAIDYFILHDFFQMSIEAYPEEWKKVVPVSNSIPHIILLRLFEQYDENIWRTTLKMTPFHKLSYKYNKEFEKNENTYYKRVIDI